MKHLVMLTIVSALFFFGCAANNAGGGTVEGLGICAGREVSNGTTISYENEDYSSIINQKGLNDIANDLTARYILCNDFPINTPFIRAINPYANEASEFTGTLEGNHRTIRELKIPTERSHAGLFGVIAAGGVVRNLKLSLVDGDATNPSISGATLVGALAGENKGTITNVGVIGGYVKGTHSSIGGLVGNNTGTITASYATGTVNGNYNVGGLVGYNNDELNVTAGTITASYATGTVKGINYIGGLVGRNKGSVTASYATGNVTGTSSDIGGLVGRNQGSVTASYFDATTTGQGGAGTAYYTNPADPGGDGQVYTEAGGNGTLIDQSNFSAWDPSIWTWQVGQWPLIQFQ